jgi:hypothetical protein
MEKEGDSFQSTLREYKEGRMIWVGDMLGIEDVLDAIALLL